MTCLEIQRPPRLWRPKYKLPRSKKVSNRIETCCKLDFVEYMKFLWDEIYAFDFIDTPHIYVIQDFFMDGYTGEKRRLLMTVPPRHLKTVMMCFFIAWTYGHHPYSNYIHQSHSTKVAVANSVRIKRILESKKHEYVFKEKFKFCSKKNTQEYWKTEAGGEFIAGGSKKPILGFGCGIKGKGFGGGYVGDDLDDAYRVNYPAHREAIREIFDSCASSRLNSRQYTPMWVFQQRVHIEDMVSYILNKKGVKWDLTHLKSLVDDKYSLFPKEFSVEDLLLMREENAYIFSTQWQGEPYIRGGDIFKESSWRWYDYDETLKFDFRVIVSDTAQKDTETSDRSVFQCWGAKGKKTYLIDQIDGRWRASQRIERAISFWEKHDSLDQGYLTGMFIEDKASGTSLIQTLQDDTGIPVFPVPRTISKVARGESVSTYVDNGRVYLPTLPFSQGIIQEGSQLSRHTKKGVHDDKIDTAMEGIDRTIGRDAKVPVYSY